ncbi:MAG: NifB/NifX family molybdenum-iron cluster-binding protein [Candidatus Woesearchaeota archaeon]
MRIAVSCQDNNPLSLIDQRFGRSKYFVIFDIKDKKVVGTEAVINKGAEQGHGAGIKASEQLGELKVECILTGQLGPNATAVLGKIGIRAYQASGKAKDAINKFLKNELEIMSETATPHSGVSNKEKSKGERIFFPLLNNKGEDSEISHHFGHAPFFGVYDVEKKELKIIDNSLDHTDPTKSPIDQIEEAVHPTTIFAKGIGGRAISLIAEKGLALKTGDYDTVSEVIKNLNKLRDQTGSCGKH